MDESCWWSSIPASKRASHVIIIGFLCVSLAAGISSHEAELRSSRQHADTRQHHNPQHHTLSATHRDANSDITFLENLFNSKHSSQKKDSERRNVNFSNNKIINNEVKLAVDSSSSSLSLLSSSVLSRLNSSSTSQSSSLNRAREGERLRSRGPSSGDSLPHHHLRHTSLADATSSRRVRRRANNRGPQHFIYKPKSTLQLFCRTNYRLAIHEDGTINGTKDNMDVYCKYHFSF